MSLAKTSCLRCSVRMTVFSFFFQDFFLEAAAVQLYLNMHYCFVNIFTVKTVMICCYRLMFFWGSQSVVFSSQPINNWKLTLQEMSHGEHLEIPKLLVELHGIHELQEQEGATGRLNVELMLKILLVLSFTKTYPFLLVRLQGFAYLRD